MPASLASARPLERAALLLPAVIAVVMFFPSVEFGHVWDDGQILLGSSRYSSLSSASAAFFQPFLASESYFRPLPLLTFGIERHFSEGDPAVSHWISVALHSINATLVGIWVRSLPGLAASKVLIPITAGVLFAIHPAVVEAVAWLSCRFELMMTLFALLALIADQNIESRRMRSIAVALFFLLAALCKEMAVSLVLVLPLLHIMRAERGREGLSLLLQKNALTYAALFSAGICYLLLRSLALGSLGVQPSAGVALGSAAHFALIIKTVGQYFALFAWPFGESRILHVLSGQQDVLDRNLVFGFFFVLGVACAGFRAIAAATDRAPLLLGAFLMALLPVINLVPIRLTGSFAAERLMYFPLIFACAWIPMQAKQLSVPALRRALRLAAASALAVWLFLSVVSVRVNLQTWKNDLTLWSAAYRLTPHAQLAQVNLAAAYVSFGMNKEAIHLITELMAAKKPIGSDLLRILVSALRAEGYAVNTALELLRSQVQREHPQSARGSNAASVRNSLAWLYLHSGMLADAEYWFLQALIADDGHIPAFYGLSLIAAATGRPDEEARYRRRWSAEAHPALLASMREAYPGLVERAIVSARDAAPRTAANSSGSDSTPGER